MNFPNPVLDIDGRLIGPSHPTYFVADIAANHDGDIGRAKELIYLAAGWSYVAKFQHFKAATIVSDSGFCALGGQQSHQSNWKKSVFEVYREASVSLDWTEVLKQTCEDAGITFFTSPYSQEIVDYIDQFVPAYKIGSGDITWIEMVEHIASKGKPYILSAGASTADEVDRAVQAGLSINSNIALLQCNTNYTGNLENFKHIQLNVLKSFALMYPNMVLGLSDHTPGHATVLGAVALGGCIIEKHFTDDIGRSGPDHAFSMDPSSWQEMVSRTRELENALGSGVKRVEDNERQTVVLQRRSVCFVDALPAGSSIRRDHLTVLRPCPADAVEPHQLTEVIGRVLRTPKQAGQYLRWNDLE